MKSVTSEKISYEFTHETYRSPSGILLNSRVAVEKRDFVSTGILTYAEGDILEVEISEYKAFELGDTVKLTVYSPGGIYTFQSTVVAKDQGALMVINPPQNRSRFAEKRENPRVHVKHDGHLLSIREPNAELQLLKEHVALEVRNISISGLGFILPSDIELSKHAMADVRLDLGFEMPCQVEIIRLDPGETVIYYGARYIDMPTDKANALRAFVLKKQVENHFSSKRDDFNKRIFK